MGGGPAASPQTIAYLQRAFGNAAVAELLERPAAGATDQEQAKPAPFGQPAAEESLVGGLSGAMGGLAGGITQGVGGLVGGMTGGGGGPLTELLGGMSGGPGQPAHDQGLVGSLGGAMSGLAGGVTQGVGGLLGGMTGAGGGPLTQLLGGISGATTPSAPVHPQAPAKGETEHPARQISTPDAAPHVAESESTPNAAPHEAEAETESAPSAAGPEVGAAGSQVGAAAAGGFDPNAKPPLGETVPEIPEPPEPKVNALGRVAHHPKAAPPPQVGEVGAPPAAEHAGFEQEAHGIEGSTAGGESGGLLDTIIQAGMDLLGSITGGLAGTARTTATAAGDKVGSATGQLTGMASTEANAVASQAQGAAASATTEVVEHVGAAHAHAGQMVGQAIGQAKEAPSAAAGLMEGLVQKVLQGAAAVPTLLSPFASIFGGAFHKLPGLLTAALKGAESIVNGALARAEAAVNSGTKRLDEVIGRAGAAVEGALDWVAQQAASLRVAAQERIAGLPSIARNALSGLVDRLLGAVARTAAGIAARARRIIDATVASARSWLQTVAGVIVSVIGGLRKIVRAVLSGLRAAIIAAVAAIGSFKNWLLAKASAFISRAIRSVIGPIYQRTYDRFMQMIGPQMQAAIERAELLFPNGLPAPPEVKTAAKQAAQDAGPGVLAQIAKGLVKPEGDHFSVGFQWAASGAYGIGFSGGGGFQLEIVLDYRRNDIGFFVSPAAGGQLNFGELSATGVFSAAPAWGTVGSFGDEKNDVLKSWSGWFTNASAGVQGGAAVGFGGYIGTGGTIYRSGAKDYRPLFSYTPFFGADKHVVPGDPLPDKVVPGSPPRTEVRPLGEVLFGTQKADAESAPGGPEAMDQSADMVKGMTGESGTTVKDVKVAGESSRIWVRPRPGKSRVGENKDLSVDRANSVKAGMQQRLGGAPEVKAEGVGDIRAEAQGRSKHDNSAEFRRAAMVAEVEIAATPDQVEPGGRGPDREEEDKIDVNLARPAPFTDERTAWGWDTTLTLGGLAGAAGKVGGYAGAGVSYSIAIGKHHFDHDTMEMIRVQVASLKMQADIMTASPLSLLRDIVASFTVHAAPDAQPMLTNAVTRWTVPMPAGVAVA